jgi:hypothetical protein
MGLCKFHVELAKTLGVLPVVYADDIKSIEIEYRGTKYRITPSMERDVDGIVIERLVDSENYVIIVPLHDEHLPDLCLIRHQ